jgi:hypothetical protein
VVVNIAASEEEEGNAALEGERRLVAVFAAPAYGSA